VQRRLIFALVGTVLASVLLVGAGVLILAQIGAGEAAEAEIATQLDALTELLAGEVTPDQLDRARAALDLDELELVVVPSPAGSDDSGGLPLLREGQNLDHFLAGDTIIVSDAGAGVTTVRGIRRIDLELEGVDGSATVGLLATRGVVVVGSEARVWFLVSAASVLAASVIAAWFLARQLSKPIGQIQRATTSIAAGDFMVRVDEDGHDEFAELGRAVNRMARELERSKKLDQQFLMSVSHDLRTPLTAITGYAEALSDRAVHDTVHTGDVIRNHAYRLERLVGDLLDLARLDANRFQLHWQTLDVGVVVGRTMAGQANQAKRHEIDVVFNNAGPLFVRADADRLAQVVGNVVDNAIKFAASEITASVRANGTHALIEICDDGPGIAPQDLPHVFERLYVSRYQPVRAENPSGMGLAIVRELTMAMGGTVAAGYRQGGGAKMTLRLPLFR
jgi:signal transduction histidine kinase